MAESFRDALTHLINSCRLENTSDTPDFLLAGYIEASLAAFEAAVIAREQWYHRPVGNGKALDHNHRVRAALSAAPAPSPDVLVRHYDVRPTPLDRHNVDPTIPA